MALFPRFNSFESRHIGTLGTDLAPMSKTVGVNSLNELIQQTVPDKIRLKEELKTPEALSEYDYLLMLKDLADKKQLYAQFYWTRLLRFGDAECHFAQCIPKSGLVHTIHTLPG